MIMLDDFPEFSFVVNIVSRFGYEEEGRESKNKEKRGETRLGLPYKYPFGPHSGCEGNSAILGSKWGGGSVT